MVPLTAINSSNGIVINTNSNKMFGPNPSTIHSSLNANPNHHQNPSYGASRSCRAPRYYRCQASLLSVFQGKSGSDSKNNVELVATVRILSEGDFDVASHALLDLIGQTVKIYLVSLDLDSATKEGKISQGVNLKFDKANAKASGKDSLLTIKFSVPKDFGKPGALLVDSDHENEFFLKSVTVKLVDETTVYFPCHSWVQDKNLNQGKQRVFFSNEPYLPSATPEALKKLRSEDLELLRGNGKGQRKTGERIYDYDIYNDLGNPDQKSKIRPHLGGNATYPYPRRCRTGRPAPKTDPTAEKALTPLLETPYIPRDENFSPTKYSLFIQATLRCFGHDVLPVLQNLLALNKPFDDFEEIHDMYVDDLKETQSPSSGTAILINPTDGTPVTFPRPGVVIANKEAWCSDQEFGRQRLAGVNPLCIQRLTEFPIKSALDEAEYGPAESAITREDLERYLDGQTVEQAIENNTLYVLDYHDAILPLVNAVNEGGEGDGKLYAARAVFHLTKYGFLLPIAIELSLPPNKTTGRAASKRVVKLPVPGAVDWEWRLAKTHVNILDAGVHELVSHWLRTHACVEPFIIATKRQLSSMHPLYTFLQPHFKDTMHINALARAGLINAGGIIEQGFSPGKYSISISSLFYKNWRFDEQALPEDLIKRGMAVKDETAKHGLKLLIKDYPFAEDGLELWAAIEQWTKDYVGLYYETDESVQADSELQAWWKEVTEIGHGDHSGASWWLPLNSVQNLSHILTTLVWTTSGHHAAVNFGQYAYFGYMPNMPTKSRQLIPERGTAEYKKLLADPGAFFLKTVSSQGESVLIMATVELLAQHMAEEEYLGDRADPLWTSDSRAVSALDRFKQALQQVDKHVEERVNSADVISHRSGTALLPYTLLAPSSGVGLTFRGVPNSISI